LPLLHGILSYSLKLMTLHVTTDFSESQIELATSPFGSVEEAYEHLITLQLQVEKELGEELLWPLSIPPRLPAEDDILIARFGDSPEGKEKELYRSDLALCYGKKMQMICGIHYNFSFGTEMLDYLYSLFGNGKEKRTFADELYFALTRNFLRYRWLLIYLFGASPTIDSTYYSVICHELKLIENCYPEFCIPNFNYEQYDKVIDEYKAIAVRSAQAVGLKICGADIIIQDIHAKPNKINLSIIELNFNPSLHIHNFPYKGENRYVEKKVLDLLRLL
jgi:hypothetical protein